MSDYSMKMLIYKLYKYQDKLLPPPPKKRDVWIYITFKVIFFFKCLFPSGVWCISTPYQCNINPFLAQDRWICTVMIRPYRLNTILCMYVSMTWFCNVNILLFLNKIIHIRREASMWDTTGLEQIPWGGYSHTLAL